MEIYHTLYNEFNAIFFTYYDLSIIILLKVDKSIVDSSDKFNEVTVFNALPLINALKLMIS